MAPAKPRPSKMSPIAQPLSTKTYERARTPPPRAAETKLKMLPRRLPLCNLLNVLSKNVRLLADDGDNSYFDGLMLMSASAFLRVVGDAGEANPPFELMSIGSGAMPAEASDTELYTVLPSEPRKTKV